MENGGKEVIRIGDLKKFYQLGGTQVKALNGVSLTICRNEYVAIMGPSGSGKSTLMNILGCLDTPSGGTYVLNGTDVSRMGDGELAQVRNNEIGVALPLIYSGVPRSERERRAKDALVSVGLEERMEHRPAELSGGQRQRVAVARALINNPSIILADEPTGNLDTKTSIDIMRLFEEIYRKGNTVILVTHEEDIAQHARRIIRLRDGAIESDTANPHPAMEI